MPDDLKNSVNVGDRFISLGEPYEVWYWCKLWNITPDRLKVAVTEVGVSVRAVRMHLKGTSTESTRSLH